MPSETTIGNVIGACVAIAVIADREALGSHCCYALGNTPDQRAIGG
jgi:hypothetical protein